MLPSLFPPTQYLSLIFRMGKKIWGLRVFGCVLLEAVGVVRQLAAPFPCWRGEGRQRAL